MSSWFNVLMTEFIVVSGRKDGVDLRLQNSRVFFSKSGKKPVKRGVRVFCSRVLEYAKIRTVLQSKLILF